MGQATVTDTLSWIPVFRVSPEKDCDALLWPPNFGGLVGN